MSRGGRRYALAGGRTLDGVVFCALPVPFVMHAGGKLRKASAATCPVFIVLSVVLLALALAGAPLVAAGLGALCGSVLGVIRALGA